MAFYFMWVGLMLAMWDVFLIQTLLFLACEGWPTFPPLPPEPVWEGNREDFFGFTSIYILLGVSHALAW